jgi:DNA-binding transcriptional MerR regulator
MQSAPYDRRGLLPAPAGASNRYRDYSEADAERLRLLIG